LVPFLAWLFSSPPGSYYIGDGGRTNATPPVAASAAILAFLVRLACSHLHQHLPTPKRTTKKGCSPVSGTRYCLAPALAPATMINTRQ